MIDNLPLGAAGGGVVRAVPCGVQFEAWMPFGVRVGEGAYGVVRRSS